MPKPRELVPKESHLLEKIEKLKKEVFRKEKKLFSLIDEFVGINAGTRDFYKKVYLPRLGKFILRLEKLKEKMLGGEKAEDSREPAEKTRAKEEENMPDEIRKEMKIIYRRLAKLYHPDKVKGDREFLTQRMGEINEAFAKGDIKSLKRYLKRADAEIGLGLSSIERIRYLEMDISVIDEMTKLYSRKIEIMKESQMYKLMSKKPAEREEVFREIEERMKFEISLNERIIKNLENMR